MPESLSITAPDPVKHRTEMFDLIAKVFSNGGYYWFRDYLARGYIDKSHYDYAASRIGHAEGKTVSHFGVWGYTMRIGRARVRTGGIGAVATSADYRGRGYMDHTAHASLSAMRDLGYDFSILFGISNFYHKFGYTRAWSDENYYVPVSDLPSEALERKVEAFKVEPREDLAKLYNRHFARATGTAVRPTYRATLYPGKEFQGLLWKNAKRQVEGYVLFVRGGQRLDCIEAVGEVEQVLRTLAGEARGQHASEVRFEGLPHDSELARRLRRGTCRSEALFNRCGGAMIRTVNLQQALTKMADELAHRLAGSALRGFKGELLIADARETAVLAIGKSGVRVMDKPAKGVRNAIRGGDEVAQLLIGTDPVTEIASGFGTRFSGAGRDLAEALFPAQHPILHQPDRY